jgi:hypothetical protein
MQVSATSGGTHSGSVVGTVGGSGGGVGGGVVVGIGGQTPDAPGSPSQVGRGLRTVAGSTVRTGPR